MAWIQKPNQSWAIKNSIQSPSNCGDWPCTAPENVILAFSDTKYLNSDELKASTSFQIVSGNEPAAAGFDNCVEVEDWNSFRCSNDNLSMLIFESLDIDREEREIQPVYVIDGNGNENKLNSMMDHKWEGFYSSMLRLNRFPAMVQAGTDYTIRMTGTPPKEMRFALRAGSSQEGIKVTIPYPTTSAFTVKANGQKVVPNSFDDAKGQPKPLDKNNCGENRYVGLANFLEFYITPGCEITLRTRDAITSSVRLEWTLEDFYADGGTTSFIDRLASVLGIHASRVYILEVYEGSVCLNYQVLDADDDNEANWTEKAQTEAAVKEFLTGNDAETVMKAKIIGVKVEGEMIQGDIPLSPNHVETTAEDNVSNDSVVMPTIFDELDFDNIDTSKSVLAGDDSDNHIKDRKAEDNFILGFAGDDTIIAKNGDDDVLGFAGNDVINGGSGEDRINGMSGNDTIKGEGGADQLTGGDGFDNIKGGNDNDLIRGDDGDDILYGESGDDTIWGGIGADSLNGGYDDDILMGEHGDDKLWGGDGDDTMFGGQGVDILQGGAGVDTIHGGSENDRL